MACIIDKEVDSSQPLQKPSCELLETALLPSANNKKFGQSIQTSRVIFVSRLRIVEIPSHLLLAISTETTRVINVSVLIMIPSPLSPYLST